MSSETSFASIVMRKASMCQSAYNEVVIAKYGRDVACVLAALIDHRDFINNIKQLRTDGWFFIEWLIFERKTGMSRKPINKAAELLESEGLICIEKGSYRRSRQYKINIGKVIEACEINKGIWLKYIQSKSDKVKLVKTEGNVWDVSQDNSLNVSCSHSTTDVPTAQQMFQQHSSSCSHRTADVPTAQLELFPQNRQTIPLPNHRNPNYNQTTENQNNDSSNHETRETARASLSSETLAGNSHSQVDLNDYELSVEDRLFQQEVKGVEASHEEPIIPGYGDHHPALVPDDRDDDRFDLMKAIKEIVATVNQPS